MAFRITCITKANGQHENPFVAIELLGWQEDGSGKTGRSTREKMYEFVTGNGEAYVLAGSSSARVIGAVTSRGTRYVKTVADNTEKDNLLKLPECR